MSSPTSVPKHLVAIELLDRAIELYLRGDSYYAALHLGGAAEEIFAVFIRSLYSDNSSVVEPVFDEFKRAFIALSEPVSSQEQYRMERWLYGRTYDAKNSVKHMRGEKDFGVNFDPKQEAYEIIDSAISNYFKIFSRPTPGLKLPWIPRVSEFDASR